MRISIEAGGTTTQLSTRPAFYFEDARLDVADNNVAIAPVLASTVGAGAYVTSINGVMPNTRGEFFIDGSECVSWGEVKGGTVMGGRPGETAEHDGMWLVDLCPSCTTCENVYRLKSEVENMKMWINTLKDVSIYGNTNTEWRRNKLSEYRITGGTNEVAEACANKDIPADDRYMFLKGLELFQQYMTVVHMWNYVVEQRNADTVISTAPEDVAAFVVQTKRPITACGPGNKLTCTINITSGELVYDNPPDTDPEDEVEKSSTRARYPLQMYIPEPSLTYEPFGSAEHGESFNTLALSGSTIAYDSLYSEEHPCHRTVIADNIKAELAGTYTLSVRFMPFIHVLCYDSNDELIGIRGTTATVDGGTAFVGKVDGEVEGSTVFYPFGIKGSTVTISGMTSAPTQQDYLNSMRAPSCSVAWKICWHVNVVWSVQLTGSTAAEEFKEDFVYLCNAPRAYFGDSVMRDSNFPVDGSTVSGGTDA